MYQHPLLKSADYQTIYDAHKKVKFKKGEYFLKKGQTANAYYCIEQGLERSYAFDTKGNEITTNFFGKNELVIDIVSLFQRVPTKEVIHALTDCVCWKIDYEAFQKLFHNIDGFSEWGRAWMTQRLFELKERSVAMITETASTRYLALQKQHPEILQQAPLMHIATYLGIKDTSLSRIRNELTKGNS